MFFNRSEFLLKPKRISLPAVVFFSSFLLLAAVEFIQPRHFDGFRRQILGVIDPVKSREQDLIDSLNVVYLALFKYHAIHEDYPPSIESLVSEGFLEAAPANPFAGRPARNVPMEKPAYGDYTYLYLPSHDADLKTNHSSFILLIYGPNGSRAVVSKFLRNQNAAPDHLLAEWTGDWNYH